MSIEIQKREIERRVRERIQSGRFQAADELLTKALDALSESSGGRMGSLDSGQCTAVESVPDKVSGAWEQVKAVLEFSARSLGAPAPH